uniref:NADH-ubiquinone oxidoreductase chain 4 n=1 Tax=Eudarcia gwangneungensis TaxID=2716286 RepID=A0A6G7MZ26_9NEOP|nr:NADH dehydrogenase subunit 4 [Eudarcia gwangneungensis]QIJ46451.1 NADH dehydrogenase subunit 4 [Eudarcia gwangneungensis]
MMKFFIMLLVLIPLCFFKKMFWLIQMMFFYLFMLLMMMGMNKMGFCNLSYGMGTDMISYVMILLSVWICGLMVLASSKLNEEKYYESFFLFNVLLLLIFLYLTFSVMNLFLFYLFFESSLIPTLMLIIGWGYQPERIQAGMYLLFYTLFVSLPMLMGIFYIFLKVDTVMMYMFKFSNMNNFLLYISMILAFLVKMPMYFVHLWLPKAHVESPVSGSMILAGIMLKLGGYGLMRILILFQEIGMKMNIIWVIISLVGGFFISLNCFCQVDVKSLIAYSSVAHMGIVLGGIMTMNYWGFMGSCVLMVGHGLCSSGMFCLANISYERLYSRSMYINKGMMNFMPSMSLWWFLLISSNMAAPPSLNLLGEISLINSLMSWSWFTIIALMLISFFSAGYSLYLYSFTQHGKVFSGMYSFYMGVSREYLILMLHWIPLNFFILKADYSMIWL